MRIILLKKSQLCCVDGRGWGGAELGSQREGRGFMSEWCQITQNLKAHIFDKYKNLKFVLKVFQRSKNGIYIYLHLIHTHIYIYFSIKRSFRLLGSYKKLSKKVSRMFYTNSNRNIIEVYIRKSHCEGNYYSHYLLLFSCSNQYMFSFHIFKFQFMLCILV